MAKKMTHAQLKKLLAAMSKNAKVTKLELSALNELLTRDKATSKSLEKTKKELTAANKKVIAQGKQILKLQKNKKTSIKPKATAKKSNAATTAEVKRLKEKISSFRDQQSDHSIELQSLSRKLNDIESDRDNLRSRISDLEIEIGNARATILQRESLIEAIYNSTSWKVSKPVRMMRQSLTLAKSVIKGDRVPKTLGIEDGKGLIPREGMQAQSQGVVISSPVADIDTSSKLLATPLENPRVRLICFYLPQFHQIAQNDEWWGEGFTEWTNVRPAKPLFEGHYQPHIPADMGYYDLSTTKTQHEQVDLARLYGIEGFCYYYYWFAGELLLETPVLNHLNDPELDFPFCLCWANENWSRRWDGLDQEVLIAQNYSADDDLAFIANISKYLRDSRYIKIDGKPLLLVYRPSLLPNAKQTTDRWRKWCRENSIGEIFIAYTQSFEVANPSLYGFDAAIEFPPNNSAPPDITKTVKPLNKNFDGKVFDWDIFLKRSENYSDPGYPIFRSVCPAWDNTARRKNNATVFLNSTPDKYGRWLSNAIEDTKSRYQNPDQRLVFVNAWNEWAEGAHLEPDQEFGHSFLYETRMALEGRTGSQRKRIVVVSHDAHPHGAQFLAYNLAKTLRDRFQFDVDLVVLGEGPLLDDFKTVATVHVLSGEDANGEEARNLAQKLFAAGASAAICNTTVSGLFAATLKQAGFGVVSLVHELKSVIEDNDLQDHAVSISENADRIIFPAEMVAKSFESFAPKSKTKELIRPQGVYKKNKLRSLEQLKDAASDLRRKHNIPKNKKIVLGVGYADHRKGFDLFVEAAKQMTTGKSNLVFIWIGHHDINLAAELAETTELLCKTNRLILPGRVLDTDIYFAGSDLFLLTSREDPYPSTVLEALDVGLLTLGFEGVTGTTKLFTQYGGRVTPAFELKALMTNIQVMLKKEKFPARWSRANEYRQRPDISFSAYVYDLLELLGSAPKSVSAVVPNYNYARFLRDRVSSIANQTYPVREIIILDDASSDDSLSVINEIVGSIDIPVRVVVNKTNSGSVFKQWKKGCNLARYEHVWLAEADDLAETDFLMKVMNGFDFDDVVLSYAQSKQISQDGEVLCDNYLDYTNDVSPVQWQKTYRRSGADEVKNGLSVKNTIPNVSAVVFKREQLSKVLEEKFDHISQFRVAGDWCVYVHLLYYGSAYFEASSLNHHRRHDESVTISRFGQPELNEIIEMQAFVNKMMPLDQEIIDRADAYINTLKVQFNLG